MTSRFAISHYSVASADDNRMVTMRRTSAVGALGALTLVMLIVAALTSGLSSPGARAAVATGVIRVEPSKDAFTTPDEAVRSFADSARLRTDGNPRVLSYLSFSQPSIPGTITRVTFEVYATSRSARGYDLYDVVDGTWTENSLTDRNRPGLDRGGVDPEQLKAIHGPRSISHPSSSSQAVCISRSSDWTEPISAILAARPRPTDLGSPLNTRRNRSPRHPRARTKWFGPRSTTHGSLRLGE